MAKPKPTATEANDETRDESRDERVARLKAELAAAAVDRFNGIENMASHKKALEAYETALRG